VTKRNLKTKKKNQRRKKRRKARKKKKVTNQSLPLNPPQFPKPVEKATKPRRI